MRITLLSLLAALTLIACAGAKARSAFDQSLDKYNELVRWHDLDRAVLFVSPSVSGEYIKRAEAAKDARFIDYEVIDVKYDEKTLEGSSKVVFTYYIYTSGTVKKVTDSQKWVYTVEGKDKFWKLTTPLPEFR